MLTVLAARQSLKLVCLVLLALTLTTSISRLGTNLLIVLLQGSQILTGLRELTLLHTLTDVPVDEGTLGIHEIKLVIQAREDLTNGCRVGDHAHGALHLGKVTTRDNGGGLVVDTTFEASGAPVNKLDGTLGLDGGNSGINILGDNVSTVHQAAGHVLSVARIALDHLGSRLKGSVGDLGYRQLLVVSLLSRNDGGIRAQDEVDAGVGHQVGLELSHINVQGTIEAQGGSEGGDDLGNQAVEVGVGGALNVQGAAANVIDGLIVKHDSNIGVLQEGVGGEHRVVGLDDSCGNLGRGVDGEAQLGLLAIVNRQTLQEQRAQTSSSTSTDSIEDQESLETSAVVCQLADAVKGKVNNLLANGVVATGKVVGSILLARDQLLGVEQLPVGTSANLVNDGRLKVKEDGTGNVLASTGLREEGVEGIISSTNGLVRGHLQQEEEERKVRSEDHA